MKFHFRTNWWKFKVNLWQNQLFSWENKWNHSFLLDKYFDECLFVSKIHSKFIYLLYHKPWKQCLWIAISHVVWKWFCFLVSLSKNSNFKFQGSRLKRKILSDTGSHFFYSTWHVFKSFNILHVDCHSDLDSYCFSFRPLTISRAPLAQSIKALNLRRT